MGGLFKSKTSTTKTPYEQNPWEPQQDYLKGGFAAGSDALDKALGVNGQITDFTADMNQQQIDALNARYGLGMGTAQDIGGQMVGAGGDLAANLNQYAQNAQTMFGTNMSDRAAAIQSQGFQMAENPYIDGQIAAVARDANQMLDLQSADVNSTATGTGNINSTRAGVLDSLNQQAAADRVGDVSAQLRGNALDRGMALADGVDARVGAERMNANQAIGDVGRTGYDLMTRGYDTMAGGFDGALNAGSAFQAQAQNEITGQQQMSKSEMDLINQYMQIVGGNYGSQGYGTNVTKSASPFQQIVGGVATVAGAMK